MLIFLPSCPLCCCCVASVISDSMQPHKRQLTRFPYPWDSPGKNTGVRCHFLLQCMKVKSESEVVQSRPTLESTRLLHPWDFPGKSTGVGVPLPSPNLAHTCIYILFLVLIVKNSFWVVWHFRLLCLSPSWLHTSHPQPAAIRCHFGHWSKETKLCFLQNRFKT